MTRLSPSGTFRKDWLPRAEDFYRDNVEQFKTLRGARAIGMCPFHPDHHPSLRIDLDRGLYYCDPCGFGGDIIDFVRRREHVDFMTAAKSLGAWDGGLQIDAVVIRRIRTEQDHREQQRQAERELERRYFEAEEWLDCIEGIYRDAGIRLSEIRRHGSVNPEEEEACWSILSLALDQVREAEEQFIRLRCSWPGAPFNKEARNWRKAL